MDPLSQVLQEVGFRALFQGYPDGIFVFTTDGRLVDLNEAVLTMTGATKSEILDYSFQPIVDPEYRQKRLELLKVANEGKTFRFCTTIQTRAGDSLSVELSNIPLRDAQGEIVGILGVARDISELRSALDYVDASQSIIRIAGRIARFAGWSLDVIRGELKWSDELFSILGVTPPRTPTYEETLRAYDEPERREVDEAVTRCMTAGVPIDLRTRIRDASGQYLEVRLLAEAVRDVSGLIVRIDGAFHDITSFIRREEEVLALEKQITKTLNEVGVALFFVGRDWRINLVNQAALELTGMTDEELSADTIWEIFPEINHNKLGALYRGAMDEKRMGAAVEYVEHFQRYFEQTAIPSGEGIVITARDVTLEQGAKRKVDEESRRATFLAEMLDLAKDAMIVRDFEGGITFWNKSAEQMYGWTFDEVKHLLPSEFLYVDPQDSDNQLEDILREGFLVGEVKHKTRDGRVLTVDCRRHLIRDAQGTPVGIFGINTDVTAVVHEQELRIRAQRMESIGTLAGGIAHDLNNVLTPIQMSIELLAREEGDVHRRELLASMEGSVKRGAEMVRQVLTFVKGVEGEREILALQTLLQEIHTFCRDALPKNIDVRYEVDEDLQPVTGDATQLMQVLINLITNARDAMSDGGQLTLRAFNSEWDESSDSTVAQGLTRVGVVIEVLDTGVGMGDEVLSRIYEPFFTTKEFGEGTGLGLSTSVAIIESHQGRIEVESVLGEGTKFRVFLPARESGETREFAESIPSLTPTGGNGRRILVVDDEAPILMMLDEVLCGEGFNVDVAQNGEAALATIERSAEPYDLIITDLNMPQLGGAKFASLVREQHGDFRIIFISGLVASSALKDEFEGGTVRFLQKPFATSELLTLIEEVLS